MASQIAWHASDDPAMAADQVPFYRFYLLRANDHIARRREDYVADDLAAIARARQLIDDYAGVEIWCGPRKLVTLSREESARLQPPVAPQSSHRAALLISRNKRLLQQARPPVTAPRRYVPCRPAWGSGGWAGRD